MTLHAGKPQGYLIAAKLTVGAGLTAVERAVLSEPVGPSPVPARIGLEDVRRVEETTRSLMARSVDSQDLCLPVAAERCYLRSLESARLAKEPVLAAHAMGRLGTLFPVPTPMPRNPADNRSA